MANKVAISFRLSPEAIEIIKELAKNLGVSQADIVELSVRKLSKQEFYDSHRDRTVQAEETELRRSKSS